MLIEKLSSEFRTMLLNAEEVWVACALIKEPGYNELISYLPEHCIIHFLVGIDLPTSVSVLKAMQKAQTDKKFESKIYHTKGKTFHPKVYLIRKSNSYVAFIGSGNLTEGGLNTNIELGYKIEDQAQCKDIIKWFNKLYDEGFPVDDHNITQYEESLEKINEFENTIKSVRSGISLKNPEDPLVGINFNDRYFKKEHHLAFHPDKWRDKSMAANKDRRKARSRFLELHSTILPKFANYGLVGLYTNTTNHIVSLDYHPENRPNQDLNAMWLSYGKSSDEISRYHQLFPKVNYKDEEDDLQSFINHARLQVRIELAEIGIWILFGKNNGGSIFDRKYFLDRMEDQSYSQRFYDTMKLLPDEYWITVNQVTRDINTFETSEDLLYFCKTDNPKNYFIIGRDYGITDPEMSEDNLPQTVLTEFKRMYPIYNMMKHRTEYFPKKGA